MSTHMEVNDLGVTKKRDVSEISLPSEGWVGWVIPHPIFWEEKLKTSMKKTKSTPGLTVAIGSGALCDIVVQVSMGVWFRVTSRGPRHWLMWTSPQRRELDRRVRIATRAAAGVFGSQKMGMKGAPGLKRVV